MAAGRLYFMVSQDEAGHWRVSARDGATWTAPVQYASRGDAIEGAVRLARAEFTGTRRPTGVRVKLGPRNWATSHTFGHEAPALFTPVG